MSKFQPITLNLRDQYLEKMKECPVKSADYTFTNLFGWADTYGLSMAFTEHFAFIHQQYPYQCLWAPVGDWKNINRENLSELLHSVNIPASQDNPLMASVSSTKDRVCMHRVPDAFVEYIMANYDKEQVYIVEARGQWEYLYSRQELATLSGNRFHKKKNHVNGFYKSYNCEYYPLTTESDVKGSLEDVLDLQNEWCKWHDCQNSSSLYAENDVIFKVIGSWDKIGILFGGSFYIDDKMAAFAVGEKLDDKNCVVHFEKAHSDYRGIYQAINHAFVNNCTEGFEFINREQDMDEEGIRKAKLSYNPVNYLKKSTLVFTL